MFNVERPIVPPASLADKKAGQAVTCCNYCAKHSTINVISAKPRTLLASMLSTLTHTKTTLRKCTIGKTYFLLAQGATILNGTYTTT